MTDKKCLISRFPTPILCHLLFSVVFLSCGQGSGNGDSDNEDISYIGMYLHEIHDFDTSDLRKAMLVIISGNCGSCTEKTIRFMRNMGKSELYKDYNRIVILPMNSAYVADSLKNTNAKIIVEDTELLGRYGLNFGKNIFLEYDKGNVVYKDWLYLDNIDSIANNYHLGLD